jgi:hypothetical protein
MKDLCLYISIYGGWKPEPCVMDTLFWQLINIVSADDFALLYDCYIGHADVSAAYMLAARYGVEVAHG